MIRTARSARSARHPRGARKQLDAWDRYARVLEAQLAALEGADPDLDRFRELAEERDALAAEIDGLGQPPLPDTSEDDELVGRIRARLAACRAADRAVMDRLGELRSGTRRALGQMDERSAGRAGYAAQTSGAPSSRHLDVKL